MLPESVSGCFRNTQQSRRVKFYDELTNVGIDLDTLVDFVNGQAYDNIIWDLIRNVYKSIPGDLNTNSMVVYSGPINHRVSIRCYPRIPRYDYYCSRCFQSSLSGCLYTGDYDASGYNKWSDLYSNYRKYWESIGTIQIPHHGSKHNYNERISDDSKMLIISSGTINKYHHPHASVIKDLVRKKVKFYWVTEKKQVWRFLI
jgi:hypothetical protein